MLWPGPAALRVGRSRGPRVASRTAGDRGSAIAGAELSAERGTSASPRGVSSFHSWAVPCTLGQHGRATTDRRSGPPSNPRGRALQLRRRGHCAKWSVAAGTSDGRYAAFQHECAVHFADYTASPILDARLSGRRRAGRTASRLARVRGHSSLHVGKAVRTLAVSCEWPWPQGGTETVQDSRPPRR